MPFARFRVQHILAGADLGYARGPGPGPGRAAPVIGSLPAGITREELVRQVASRLNLSADLAGSLLARTPAPRATRAGAPRGVLRPRGEQAEKTFLALCIALHDPGAKALRRVSLEEHFTSPLVRRAAEHLRTHITAPLDGLPRDDDALAGLMAELQIRADREQADPSMLEVELLQLEKHRLERRIAEGGAVAELAEKREQVTKDIRQAVTQVMERTVAER